MVGKYAKKLNKIILAKNESPGSRILLVPADHTFSKNSPTDADNQGELKSKKNFDLIRKRNEIRQKHKLEVERQRGEDARRAYREKYEQKDEPTLISPV